MLLDDFQDIDRHLAPADELFRLVSDYQEIEAKFADFLTEEQEAFVRTFLQALEQKKKSASLEFYSKQFRQFGFVYQEFKEALRSEGLGYEGMILREAAQMEELFERPFEHILFAG